MKFTSPLPPHARECFNSLVMGDVSVGKSSLLNALFGLHLAVGVGHTTNDVSPVHQDGRGIIWDSAGVNRDLSLYDVNSLNFIYGVQLVAILYSTSLCTVATTVAIVNKIKGASSFVCVRTQCDRHSARDALSLDQEMERDRQFLEEMGIVGVRLFKTAAEGPNRFDADRLRAVLLHAA